jgi:hypothetical protein
MLYITFIAVLVVDPFPFIVLISDYDSAFLTLASFTWLLFVLSGSSDRFTLICVTFAYEIAFYGSLRGPGHSFNPFSTIYNYFYTVLVCFESIVDEPTTFLVLGSPLSLPFILDKEREKSFIVTLSLFN